MSGLKRLIQEIHRRSLWQVLLIYVGASWVVLEAADVIVARLALPEWVYGVAIVFLLVGLPIVLATAFVQEGVAPARAEPPGVAEAAATGTQAHEASGMGRLFTWRNAIMGGALAFGLWGVVATGLLLLGDRPDQETVEASLVEPKSVAVIPFTNMSADQENEYFAQGMTEELISKLSRVQDLQVAARTSVERYKGTEKDIREIAEELRVRYVLEGSVRKSGDRVRITAQLIAASTGFHLWSDDFDGELKDVFAVQEQTALEIVEALDLHLSPKEAEALRHRYTQNAEAYDAYLRGWALAQTFTFGSSDRPERLEVARGHFEQALALDPNYALALTGLSEIEGYYYFFGIDRTPRRLERAEELARRALAIDPELAEAHVALGDIYGTQGDWGRAIETFRQGLRLDPRNAYAWEELAWALNSQQPPDPKEAEKAAREAIRLQPGWFWSHFQLGWALRLQARYEEATAALEYALQLNPDFPSAYHHLGHVYLDQGDYNRALAHFNTGRETRESPRLLVDIAAAYAGLGDEEKALAELEEALASGYRDFARIDANPHFASLRDHPRFQALLERYEQ